MTIEFIWQLPTGGDGRYGEAARARRGERDALSGSPYSDGVSDPRGRRFNYYDYLHQVARAAELSGFDGVRISHDLQGEEAWIVAGYVARGTRRIKLVAEFEAAWGSAVYAAKNAASFQRFTGGRLAWQIAPGGAAEERRRHADYAEDADVLPRIDEFLTVARGVLTTAPFNFKGRFFEVGEGGFRGTLANNPVPRVYLSGATEEALALSARQADVHVLDAAPPDVLREQAARLAALAAAAGRQVAIGLRVSVLARETEAEARRDAAIHQRQIGGTGSGSAAASGADAVLVGSFEQVTDGLAEYAAAGVSSFLLSAVPHLEEAYRFGENVLPALRERLAVQRGATQAAHAA
ncbi:alkanesulfonate monooxygenase [Massilia sp. Root418]|uniref:LLM class flavin-dependent oxidoreductase n=1 Tax=Massilia sp. Root418 TaxID=1736532 RepID=UPI0006F54891|nr:LLM class flavin-dependent oxidoreductase [Massilia sp. Root418]KQW93263.1 alkanesulfonate monooxygenase [Massilia sp. Root418]